MLAYTCTYLTHTNVFLPFTARENDGGLKVWCNHSNCTFVAVLSNSTICLRQNKSWKFSELLTLFTCASERFNTMYILALFTKRCGNDSTLLL